MNAIRFIHFSHQIKTITKSQEWGSIDFTNQIIQHGQIVHMEFLLYTFMHVIGQVDYVTGVTTINSNQEVILIRFQTFPRKVS